MTCEFCCYYWKEDYESRPSCHFDADNRYPDELAPCEYESDNDNLTGGAY